MPLQLQELLSRPASADETVKCELFAQVMARYGKGKFKALGSSMLPSVWPGDTLVVERRELSRFLPGEIAVYIRCGRLFAHRVVQVLAQPAPALITRGDAMAAEDPPVMANELLGCVVAIVPGPRGAYRIKSVMATLRSRVISLFRRCLPRRPLLQQ